MRRKMYGWGLILSIRNWLNHWIVIVCCDLMWVTGCWREEVVFLPSCKWARHLIRDVFASYIFTFMHLADAFFQSDLQCIQAIHLYCQYVRSLGIEPTTFALLTQCSNHWATFFIFGSNSVYYLLWHTYWKETFRSSHVNNWKHMFHK